MAITCLKLHSLKNPSKNTESSVNTHYPCSNAIDLSSCDCSNDEQALKLGDYRDILSLTRVLMYGPESKAEVDIIMDRYVIQDDSSRNLSFSFQAFLY